MFETMFIKNQLQPVQNFGETMKALERKQSLANQQLVTHKLKINVVCVISGCELRNTEVISENLLKNATGLEQMKHFHCFREMAVETELFHLNNNNCYASHLRDNA